MRILATGSKGMLGQDLVAHIERSHQVIPLDLPELDITDPRAIKEAISGQVPDVVIHTAAFTAVDECETRPDFASLVNAGGTRNIAIACQEHRIPLLYISTDYVFDGEKPTPYLEEDTPHPINVYGESKLQGEQHVRALLKDFWIVRTSWLFGPLGKNFVKAILEKAQRDGSLRVVDDQFGAPTYTVDLAQELEQIVTRGGPGIYHVTNQGYCSWFEFAKEIVRQAGVSEVRVDPIPTSASHRAARRPRNSRLANARLQTEGLSLLPPWQEGLSRYLSRAAEVRG